MPELPGFLAARAERWFGHPATVAAVEALSPRFRRVRFAGEALRGRRWSPGQVIEFRVGERAFRHYTPARYDTAAGELEVIFYPHGRGLGSAWAAGLAPDREALIMGPGDVGTTLRPAGDWHLFLGDETAIGALHALTAALPAGAAILGAAEVEAGEEGTVAPLLPHLTTLARGTGHGDALADWLAGAALPAGGGTAYLIGHARSIQRHRDALLARGVERRRIRCKPYWADGKRGL